MIFATIFISAAKIFSVATTTVQATIIWMVGTVAASIIVAASTLIVIAMGTAPVSGLGRWRAAVIALGAADHAVCADLALTVIVGLVVLDTCTLMKLRLMTKGDMWFWVSWI